MDEIEKIIYQK